MCELIKWWQLRLPELLPFLSLYYTTLCFLDWHTVHNWFSKCIKFFYTAVIFFPIQLWAYPSAVILIINLSAKLKRSENLHISRDFFSIMFIIHYRTVMIVLRWLCPIFGWKNIVEIFPLSMHWIGTWSSVLCNMYRLKIGDG